MAQTFGMIAEYGESKEEPVKKLDIQHKATRGRQGSPHWTRSEETSGSDRGPEQFYNKWLGGSYRLGDILSLNKGFLAQEVQVS
jgi:hypothetical protein